MNAIGADRAVQQMPIADPRAMAEQKHAMVGRVTSERINGVANGAGA